jgi:[acyl-carrier-protein] S-malonyltransferase
MRLLISHGPAQFIEVGPGKVLCGLMRQIDRTQSCVHVEEVLREESTFLRA